MVRMIDADEIRWADHYDSDGNLSKYKVAFSDEMPPTVDAVPVIRCMDCKYSSPNRVYGCRIHSFTDDLDKRLYSDDFCSRGERKEE